MNENQNKNAYILIELLNEVQIFYFAQELWTLYKNMKLIYSQSICLVSISGAIYFSEENGTTSSQHNSSIRLTIEYPLKYLQSKYSVVAHLQLYVKNLFLEIFYNWIFKHHTWLRLFYIFYPNFLKSDVSNSDSNTVE